MFELLFYALVFFTAAAVGSFLNVVIDRLPSGRPLFISRSVCDSCHKQLRWYDLFPVLSFLLLGGKCRFCRATIPPRLFLIEVTTGLFVVFLSHLFLNGTIDFSAFLFLSVVFCCLLAIFFIDLFWGIIPDQILFVLLVIVTVYNFTVNPAGIISYALSGFGAFIFFLLIFLATKGRGMGFGDVKFSFIIGLLVGYPKVIVALYAAFLTGAVISLILVFIGKKHFKRDTIPFGPFLIIGIAVAYFFTDRFLFFLPLP
jgi:leader peptidase (prepilin peptidase)/N-methyltransferase